MKKNLLKTMMLAVACLLGVGQSAWADVEPTTIFSQNFDGLDAVPTDWTQENGTLSLETDETNKYLKESTSGSGSRGAWYKGTGISTAVEGKANWTIEFDCLIAEGTNTSNYSQGVWILGSDLTQSWGAPSKFIAGFSKGSSASVYTLSVNSAATTTTVNLTSNTWYHYIFAYDKTKNKLTISIQSQDKKKDIMAAAEFDYDYQTSGIGDLNSIQFQAGRCSSKSPDATHGFTCLDNIVITYDESSVPTEVGYTVTYKCGETELKTVEGTGYTGSAPSISTADIYANDKKYIYESDNVATVGNLTADPANNVYTATFREAAVYNFSVNAVDDEGATLATILGSTPCFEGDSYTYGIPQYVLSGTTLYNIAAAGSGDWYQRTVSPTKDGVVEKLVYNNGTVSDVVFYTEGENISGASEGTNTQRASNGKMGHTGSSDVYKEVTTLAPGVYQIYWRGVNGNSATRTCNFKVGEDLVYTCSITQGVNVTDHSDAIIVSNSATLSFACTGSSASGLDWMYIVKTGEASETLTINSYGWSSYAPSMNVAVPEGADVYYVSSKTTSEATLTKLATGTTVKAGEGLLVKGTGTATFNASAETPAVLTNLLAGALVETQVTSLGAGTVYVLGNVADVVGLYKYTGSSLAAGKAYMYIPAGAAAPARFVFADDEATGISTAAASTQAQNAQAYNLAGQKVANGYKGIVIINGKKMTVK